MNKETLQKLVSVHNTLYNITVTGDAIIPMANALALLQSVIGPELTMLREQDSEKCSEEGMSGEECTGNE